MPTFTSYGTTLYGSQAQKGSSKYYADVSNVYSLVIVRKKLGYFSDSHSYHHDHLLTGSCRAKPPIVGADAGHIRGLLGPQYSIIELGKFTKSFAELTTTADKLFYFMKNTDKLTMPFEQAVAYLNDGGPMSAAVTQMIKYSQEEEFRIATHEIEEEKSHLPEYLEYAEAEGEARGETRGEARGKTLGEATAKLSFARKLLAHGFAHAQIAELTELSLEQIEKLNQQA